MNVETIINKCDEKYSKEDIETMQEIIHGAQEILLEYSQDITTPRPQWNKISKT